MTVRAYYDGCGHSNDNATKILTLSGIVSTDQLWPEFESKWRDMLRCHNIRQVHMTDLMALQGEYKEWDETRQQALVRDAFNVIGGFRGKHLWARSASVPLSDYRKARKTIANLRAPEAICVNFCFGGPNLPPDYAGRERCILLHFDRGEKFMHTVNRVWQKFKKEPNAGWPRQVLDIVSTNAVSCYPIQAADILAWITNRYHRDADCWNGWLFMSTYLTINHSVALYDYSRISREYPKG